MRRRIRLHLNDRRDAKARALNVSDRLTNRLAHPLTQLATRRRASRHCIPMRASDTEATDAEMMRRCLALSQSSGAHGEYPYAAVDLPQGQAGLRVDQPRVARSRRDAACRGGGAHGSAEGAGPHQPRRLHDLRKCGALRVLLLCHSRNPHRPGGLWPAVAGDGWAFAVEHSRRHRPLDRHTGGIRASLPKSWRATWRTKPKRCSRHGIR